MKRYADKNETHALLYDPIVLNKTVSLHSFFSDLNSEDLIDTGTVNYVARKTTARGVIDVEISQLQFNLLTAFHSAKCAVAIIKETVSQIGDYNVTQQQLAQLCLNSIRNMLKQGYLTKSPIKNPKHFFSHIKFKKTQKILFPDLEQ